MSRTVTTRSLPVVALDGRADARGSVTVSLDTARAALAALAGLTVHPWPGVDFGEGRPSLSLGAALVGVPAAPEAIIAAVDALEADGRFESDNRSSFWRPDVRSLGGGRFEWRPFSGREDRTIVLHFRAEDAVISWRSDAPTWGDADPSGWGRVQTGTVGHRSRFIGQVVAWASPRSVAVAPMAGHSGPVRAL